MQRFDETCGVRAAGSSAKKRQYRDVQPSRTQYDRSSRHRFFYSAICLGKRKEDSNNLNPGPLGQLFIVLRDTEQGT